MGDSQVKVLPVPEGSIIWIHNIDFGEGVDDIDVLSDVLQIIGHAKVVLLHTNGEGIVDVIGPDELVERVRAAFEEAPDD